MADPGRIVVVRHGETEWSAAGRHTSHTDLSLTPLGRRRMRALGPALRAARYALVLSSPLKRARESCDLAGFAAEAEICDDLHEWDYGDYEGMTTLEIWAQDSGWSLWRDGCPGGESPEQVQTRADRVLERALDAEGDVLAFAHGHVLRVLAARWIESPAAGGAHLALGAGALGVLGHERHTRVLERWNASPEVLV